VPEKESKGLTLDRAVRLLRSALAETALTVEEAIALMEYREERNRIARASHDKAWHARHEGVKYLLL
jgi:signal transduction histidine kinase